jgi:hypothetical protein
MSTTPEDTWEQDSEWDCSCATPEMCRGGCCTCEDFADWCAEEKEEGIEHAHPVREFKAALKGIWGLERYLKRSEGDLNAMKASLEELLHEKEDQEESHWKEQKAVQEHNICVSEEYVTSLREKLAAKKAEAKAQHIAHLEEQLKRAKDRYRSALRSNIGHGYDRICSNFQDEVEDAERELADAKAESD